MVPAEKPARAGSMICCPYKCDGQIFVVPAEKPARAGSMICCPYKYRQIFVGAEYYSAHNDGF